jgi:peptidoglycan/xylan/chitin deacetylase (PgdA/CDA1 family)
MTSIALTFDDGPSEWTEPILDLLAAHGVSATFFVIGKNVEQRSDVLRRIAADGHEVGNHTWSHPHLARDCDDAGVLLELERTNEVVESILGTRMRLFRCPYYDVDERIAALAATLGLVHTPGTVTPPDWLPTARGAVIATLVLPLIRAGSIVGLHDGSPPKETIDPTLTRAATVQAVAAILPRLGERGYEPVTASALLAASEGPPDPVGLNPAR